MTTARIFRPTGHPPPLEQIRDQVRSPTGATYVRTMTAFHRLGCPLPPMPARPVELPGLKLAVRLMTFLEGIEASGGALPYPDEIALHIDEGWNGHAVMSGLRQLARNGDIAMWCAREETAHAGEFKIRMPRGQTILATQHAPAYGKV